MLGNESSSVRRDASNSCMSPAMGTIEIELHLSAPYHVGSPYPRLRNFLRDHAVPPADGVAWATTTGAKCRWPNMTNTDHEKGLGSFEQDPKEMPLPSDPKVIFLGGLFVLAALGGAYLASEIVLPL